MFFVIASTEILSKVVHRYAPLFYKNAQKPQGGASFNSVESLRHGLEIEVWKLLFLKDFFLRKMNKQGGRLPPAYFP